MNKIKKQHNNNNNHHQYKDELIKWIVNLNFTHGLTLNHNRSVSIYKIRNDLKQLHRDIDRHLLGCRFNTKPNRSFALFIIEGDQSSETLHTHSLWRIDEQNIDRFEALFKDDTGSKDNFWKRIIPSGSHKLIVNDNPLAAAIYDTKTLSKNTPSERMFFSNDFLSANYNIGK